MTVPVAVSPSTKSPGTFLSVDLLGGAANPGSAALRILLIGCKNTADGDITADGEVRTVFGADDVLTSHGAGNIVHLAAKQLFGANGTAGVDVAAPASGGGATATATQTFAGTATENSTVRFRIHGRTLDVAWLNGEAVATFHARAVAAINALGNDLFTIASGVSPDIVHTAKSAGPWGNDVLLNASIVEGGGGISISANPTSLSGGTTEPDITNVLGLVTTRRYRRIVLCASNADASATGSSANPDRLLTHLLATNTGAQALLQVGLVGHTGTIANVSAGAVDRNSPEFEYVYCQDSEDLPGELAGAEAGDAMRWVALRPNYNRIGNRLNVLGPRDPVASKLTAAEIEALLNTGVSPIDLEPVTNEPFLVRPITTHSLNGANPDFRAFDMPDIDATFSVAEDLQVALATEFANASISPDLPAGADPLPPGVVEERDIKAFVIARLQFWANLGVIDRTKMEAALANGDFSFGINVSDATQFDIFGLANIIRPLAKIGLVLSKANN